MKSIAIGKVSVELADYAVGSCAILGIRDSGKTVTAKGIAEQLIDNDVPIIVFDAVGKWRWMKTASETSRGKEYKVVVAGGREPDLPLTIHSVPEIVRSALKERIPLIIDLFDKHLSKADWRRIVQQAIHIIHYENEGGAVHVFLEEAAEFVPQKIYDAETYAEVEKLVRMGGNASVGITLINQRSQEVNKAVLDNCSTALVLGCQVGKNAIEAVEKWIERLDPKTADELTESLPRLKPGEAWVWTRKSLDKPSREQMPMCRSFHPDRRTPETVLKSLKPANIDEFVTRMAKSIPKVIEEAKAKDPKHWQAKVAELERKLKQAEQAKPALAAKTKIKHEAALTDSERKRLTALIDSYERLESVCSRIENMATEIKRDAFTNRAEVTFFKTLLAGKLMPVSPVRMTVPTPRALRRLPSAPDSYSAHAPDESNGDLPSGERKILTAAAQYPEGASREQLTILTGYKRSTRDAYVARLKEKDYLSDNGNSITATAEGVEALGHSFDPLPTGQELVEYWRNKLPQGERAIFEIVVAEYPKSVARDVLEEPTGFKRSTRDAYISRMIARRVINAVGRGEIKASEEFFK